MPVDSSLAYDQWTRFQECREGHLEFIRKADRCDKFFIGDQWQQADLERLAKQRRPAITINKIISTLGTLFGEQIYNRNETLFRPSTGAMAETAEILCKVWKQISQNNQLPWARSDLFADGVIRSRGFVDIRLKFTDSMQGEVEITNLNSKNVVIDPDAEEYDPDSWNDIFVTKWLTPQDIEILYNKDDAERLSRNNSSFAYGYDSIAQYRDRFGGTGILRPYSGEDKHGVRRNIRTLDRQYRRLDKQEHFVDTSTGDMRPIPADWDRNRIARVIEKGNGRIGTTKKLVKRIRWTVTADDVVLHDEWSTYKHFTPVPYFPYFRYGQTVGLVENLLGPQELLNKVTSQELHVVNSSANSGWKVRKGGLINMAIEVLGQVGASTGLVLELEDLDAAEKIAPNSTPQGLDRISYKAEEHIKSISNISDSMQGFDREDVAAKAIQAKTSRGSINMTKVLDNLERTDFLIARNVVDLVQGYYTEQRLMNITHEDLLRESETIEVNRYDEATGEIVNDLTIGEFNIIVTTTPYRATLEDSQFEQSMSMREQGVAIKDETLIENSRLMRKAEIVRSMQAEANSPEVQAQKALEKELQQAEVALRQAEAINKRAEAELKTAKTQAELASIQQANAKLQIDAAAAQGGDAAGQAEAEMAIEAQKAEQEISIEERKFAHEMAMKEREMTMKEKQYEQDAQLKQDMHEHQKGIAAQQAEAQAQSARLAVINKSHTQGAPE